MNTCIISPLEEALIRVVKKCNCDAESTQVVFTGTGKCHKKNVKIESHLNRVRWYWQETEVPTGKGQRNVKIESHLNRVRWFWHEEEDEEDYIVLDVPNVRLK